MERKKHVTKRRNNSVLIYLYLDAVKNVSLEGSTSLLAVFEIEVLQANVMGVLVAIVVKVTYRVTKTNMITAFSTMIRQRFDTLNISSTN